MLVVAARLWDGERGGERRGKEISLSKINAVSRDLKNGRETRPEFWGLNTSLCKKRYTCFHILRPNCWNSNIHTGRKKSGSGTSFTRLLLLCKHH